MKTPSNDELPLFSKFLSSLISKYGDDVIDELINLESIKEMATMLFNNNPNPVIEIDFSRLIDYFESATNVKDVILDLTLSDSINLLMITRYNSKFLEMFKCEDIRDFLFELQNFFTMQYYDFMFTWVSNVLARNLQFSQKAVITLSDGTHLIFEMQTSLLQMNPYKAIIHFIPGNTSFSDLHSKPFSVFESIIDQIAVPIIVEINDIVKMCNTKFLEVFEYPSKENVYNFPITSFHPAEDREIILNRGARRDSGLNELSSYVVSGKTYYGETFPVLLIVSSITYETQIYHVVFFFELEKLQHFMQYLPATTNLLQETGIFEEELLENLKRVLIQTLTDASLAKEFIHYDSSAHELLNEIVASSDEVSKTLNQLYLALEKSASTKKKPINLSEIVEDTDPLLRSLLKQNSVINYDLSPDLPLIYANELQIQQLLINLVQNALESAIDMYSQITVSTGLEIPNNVQNVILRDHKSDKTYVYLSVSDTGEGFAIEDYEKIFHVIFTTKNSHDGLGLAIVKNICDKHDAFISVESFPSAGSTFKIYFPIYEDMVEEFLNENKEETLTDQPRILICEQDDILLESYLKFFSYMNLQTIIASSAVETKQLYFDFTHSINMVLIDLSLEQAKWADLYLKIRNTDPFLPIIFTYVDPRQKLVVVADDEKNTLFLQKPFTFQQFKPILFKYLSKKL